MNDLFADKPDTRVQVSDESPVAIRGQDTTLQCSIDASPGHTSVRWEHAEGTITTGGRYDISGDSLRLVIKKLVVADNGDYVCIATSAQGEGVCLEPYTMTVLCKF